MTQTSEVSRPMIETPYVAWLRSMQEAERAEGNDDSPENDTGVAK